MKGLGTNEATILQLLTARSNAQRQQIKAAFKTLHGKDLVSELKSELGGKLETLIVAMMATPVMFDVTSLRNAIKGAGTNEKVLIEILASRTQNEIREIIKTYKQEYDHNLESDVSGEVGGHFKEMLVILLQANRQQGVQEGTIQSDAQALFNAGEKKFGTDEDQFITILGNRSAEHLRRVFDAYMKLSGHQIEESIQRETSGGLRDVLLAVVKCARSVPAYLAECLYNSLKGAGTDDATLIRIMVSRSEIDLLDIRAEFRKSFATSLHNMIKNDTTGDYCKTLLLLCGGTDEATILQLLTARSNAQRQQIKAAYKTLHGKVTSVLSQLFKAWISTGHSSSELHICAFPAVLSLNSFTGAGTDEKVLVEILASRTQNEIGEIIKTYKKEYDHDLEQDVSGDTSGHFKRMLVILLQVMLCRMFDAYMKLSGYQIEESIQRETSGGLRDVLLAVGKTRIHTQLSILKYTSLTLSGAGTDDATLIRIMVSRSEIDLLDIRAEFRKSFATSLHNMIKNDSSGDYRKTLLLLCGGDDA
uniref:Annexin n=1 Tax=Pygocentrus nattereri TaxID=42514 RepID=A0AAR2JZY0_PYGNA